MPSIQNNHFNSYTPDQKNVLELEKKYFGILYEIFSQQSFKDELKAIMQDINKNWAKIHTIWGKENVIDIPVERHVNFRIYNDESLRNRIQSVYSSVISSDTAFVTEDAVVNIDSKTISFGGNAPDWKRQTVGCNQISFDNKLNFTAPKKKTKMKITSLLQPYHNSKPVLSFFLSMLYYSDKKNEIDSWYTDSENIKFSCVPHNVISNLFNYDIVDGVKAYNPPNVPSPTGTSSVRIAHESLKNRYDSCGEYWEGFKSWTI